MSDRDAFISQPERNLSRHPGSAEAWSLKGQAPEFTAGRYLV